MSLGAPVWLLYDAPVVASRRRSSDDGQGTVGAAQVTSKGQIMAALVTAVGAVVAAIVVAFAGVDPPSPPTPTPAPAAPSVSAPVAMPAAPSPAAPAATGGIAILEPGSGDLVGRCVRVRGVLTTPAAGERYWLVVHSLTYRTYFLMQPIRSPTLGARDWDVSTRVGNQTDSAGRSFEILFVRTSGETGADFERLLEAGPAPEIGGVLPPGVTTLDQVQVTRSRTVNC
jgi:hypothetical protein